jgi:alcohol dehydrogenase
VNRRGRRQVLPEAAVFRASFARRGTSFLARLDGLAGSSLIILALAPFEFHLRTRIVFGTGTLDRLGTLAGQLGARHALLVADRGIVAAGYVDAAAASLRAAGVAETRFHDVDANPDSQMVGAGRQVAQAAGVDSLIAIGGGSSLDCAKGINFLLAGGGTMRDYRGYGKARGRLLPSIGIPTTAGTGSEAQSYAIISDAETHAKMACGDPGAAFKVAILDPALTVSQPRHVTAVAGYDALSHAVESYVTLKRTPISDLFAREAWHLLSTHYARVLEAPADVSARGAMLLGSHYAGIAIEQSMLGATHACANPLTARYGTTHGIAIGVMLPHVVRWNREVVGSRYDELCGDLAGLLDQLARIGGLPATLRDLGVPSGDVPALADDAATQWTGTFNPRPFGHSAALDLYRSAY